MGYREEGGLVILTMSREDYGRLMASLGVATEPYLARGHELREMLSLINRLNEGNPNYTPYKIPGKL